ncbi:MAG: undecaprenyl-phosphate glucose phosphotransferase [Bacilli bacterium]
MEVEKDYSQFLLKLIVDSIIIFIAWFTAYGLRFYIIPGGTGEPLSLFAAMSVLVWLLFLYFLNHNRLYRITPSLTWQVEIQLLLYSAVQVFLTLTVILYYLYGRRVSRLTIAIFMVIVSFLLILERIIINRRIIRLRASGRMAKRVLLIGYGAGISRYIKEVQTHPENGLQIVGQYNALHHGDSRYVQFDGTLEDVLATAKPQIIVIGYPTAHRVVEKEMIGKCYDLIQRVLVIPDLPYSMIGSKIIDFHSIPVMQLNDVSITFFQRVGKRILDFVLTLIGTIIISPLLLVLALLVKITSPGPVLYKQKRITEDGKEFTMLKFRSMTNRPPGEEDGKWTTKDDPRVTPFGKFIRRTSLDELPQLFNVLKGEMSLIGPRPERPELVDRFVHEIPGYQLRHKVKSGITGWAQVNGYRGDTSLEGRIEYDLTYIKNWSFLLDFKIIIFTFVRGFVNKNAY